jgi:protein-tyrosine kinase
MGKISEALEKSEKEKENPIPRSEAALPLLPERKEESTSDSFMPVLEEVAEIDQKVITISNPDSFEAEQFRHLRNSLTYTASSNPIRSLMVTSTVSEEGKTFVACNLAASVARNINQHVLLIDCDLRRPSVHKFFNIRSAMGLSSYLTNGSSISGLLIRTPYREADDSTGRKTAAKSIRAPLLGKNEDSDR